MQYQNLPDALKQQKHFCLWKREMRKGNYTKVPYQTNGARARPNDLSTFTDFTSALSIYNGGGYDGIGLLNDDLVGLDCDDCVNDDGTLTDLAVEVINTVDSYAEYSPSGKGIRIWARAADLSYDKAKYYINNRKLKLEIYVPGQTNRFLTLTGNAIGNKDVEERSGEIQNVLDAYMLRPVATKPKTSVPHMSYLSDEEIVQKASKAVNADKFIPLWNGDALADAGADHSALDLRLCSILAFYSGGNAEQMDRLFRESGLMRDKWDSRRGNGTYGDMTIAVEKKEEKPVSQKVFKVV